MGLWTTCKAVFYDNRGEQINITKFNPKKDNFKLPKMNKSYLVDLKSGSQFLKKGWIRDVRYFFYPINSPSPFNFSGKEAQLILDSDMFNIQLESKVARDLNRLADKRFSDLLTPRNMIIGGVVLFVIYLLSTGKLNSVLGG